MPKPETKSLPCRASRQLCRGYAAVSPDGESFAAGTGTHAVRIWRTEDGMPIKTLVAPKTWPNGVAFSADGKRILVSAWETISIRTILQVFGMCRAEQKSPNLGGHRSDTHGGTFSHDGRLVATVSVDGTARLWDGITGRFVSSLGEESGGLKLIDAKVELADQEINAAFSPDDQFLATVSMDGGVHIWDVKSGSQFAVIRSHKGLVEHVAFSPIGHLLLTASHDGTARLWDIDGVLTTTLRHQRPPTFAAFSPDGTRVVTGGQNRVGHIWDVASGREIARLESKAARFTMRPSALTGVTSQLRLRAGALSYGMPEAGGRSFGSRAMIPLPSKSSSTRRATSWLSTSVDGTARLWNASTGDQISVLNANGYLRKALFSPDGQLVLTALNDNTARIWKTDGNEFTTLVGHENQVTAAAFSPDGRLVATGSLDGTAKIWSLADGRAIATLRGHTGPLTDVAFSQDGQLIVTASRDRTARIWRVKDGAPTGHSRRTWRCRE